MGVNITKENLEFLNELKSNNNREWFTESKPRYIEQHENTISFADDVLELLKKHDKIDNVSGKKSLMRIYKDVRFSKDKSPYKTNWAGYYKRSTSDLRGSYYFHIAPDECFVGGGFWKPESIDMKLIRDAMVADEKGYRKVVGSKKFKEFFGIEGVYGEKLKNVPRGYDKESTAGDLLRMKQFLIRKSFSKEEMLSDGFAKKVDQTFKALRPFFDWMSYALTHDGNGEKI